MQDIVVESLSKRYRLGQTRGGAQLREAIRGLFSARSVADDGQILWALRDVTFSVDEGEVVGLIGRNGAGKSTLLKVLSRITQQTSGTVRVRGRVASLLEVGTGFHDELTGGENIYLNGSILGMSKRQIEAKWDAIVSFAGVERFIDTPIKRYSSGMRLRLGFAVAAHLDPDILIVDEVLAVGDAEFQKKCLKAMDDLHSGGRTVLFVSHNMSAIENLCSRVIWLQDGAVRADGPPRDVIAAYLESFSSSEPEGFDLERFETRTGSGAVRFTRLEILDAVRRPMQVVRSGDRIVFRLHYRARERVEHPHFGVRLDSDLGTRITEVSTWASGLDTPVLESGEGYYDVEVESLNFMPARYHVGLWIEAVGPVVYDVIDRCGSFDVEPANAYGTGRGIDRRFGLVFLPCRWSRGDGTGSR